MDWSVQQRAVFDWVEFGEGSAVAEAVAGAGKTTTLVEAVRRMRGSVYLGAYNSKMGEELKKRVADLKNVMAGTFHSAGFGALRRASTGRLKVDDKKVRYITATMLQPTAHRHWEKAVCSLVSMAKQRGLGVRDLVEAPRRRDWMDLIERHEILDAIEDEIDPNRLIDYAARVLEASNADMETIDFDDMVYLPLLRNLRMFRNDWVLVDEAQDTNPTRRALAKRMLAPGGRLFAVGDPHQAIFGFTGADGDSLELIKRQFSAVTLKLSVTYRCPKNVVAVARGYVSHIEPAATAPDGEHAEMSYEEMVKFSVPGDAILCRFNRYIVELCFALIRAGKPAKIEGRSVGEGLAALAGRWKVKTLDALDKKLETYLERETAKCEAKGEEARLDRVMDQVATIRVLMQRGAEQNITTVAGLQEMIRSMFGDGVTSEGVIVLSSVHRSKGLEWRRVFILGRSELMPSRRAKQEWMIEQEINLCYVAVTRAQDVLIDVRLKAGV